MLEVSACRQMDDETGLEPRLVGFDLTEPTCHNKGKPEAIATLRHTFPYETIVMVGDGITGPSHDPRNVHGINLLAVRSSPMHRRHEHLSMRRRSRDGVAELMLPVLTNEMEIDASSAL